MSLTYIADCAWKPFANAEPRDPAYELPTTSEVWCGRSDQRDTFLATYPVGAQYIPADNLAATAANQTARYALTGLVAGQIVKQTSDTTYWVVIDAANLANSAGWAKTGFITDRVPRANTPFEGVDQVDLIIARKPDFLQYLSTPSQSIKSASKGANTTGYIDATGAYNTGTDPDTGNNQVQCNASASYYAPETRYTYFADGTSAAPSAPRFSGILGSSTPSVIRSSIKVSGNSRNIEYYGNAPTGIVSVTSFSTTQECSSFEAVPIPGTPWYRCTETWSKVYS